MDNQEAEKILKIMSTADGGCVYCVRDLFIKFMREFPEFKELAEKIFEAKFDKNIFDTEFEK